MIELSNLVAALTLDNEQYLKALGQSQKEGENVVNRLSKVGGAVAGGLALAGGAALAFLGSTIEPASDLNETMSKVQVVFGDNADAILKWGDTSATAFGMSKNSALTAAGTYGNLFRALNLSEDQSAQMSTSLVELAGDLASFNNLDPTDVLDRLRSGLVGQTEPLRALGININEAALQEKALELGLWDGKGALDASARAQASYALILEQTKLAQGDFARTSDGLANQQRILSAEFEDIRAKIGTKLLPVITKFTTTLSEYLAKPETQAAIQNLADTIGTFATNAASYLPTALNAFQNLFGWLQANQGVVMAILAVLGVAVAAWATTTAISIGSVVVSAAPLLLVIALIAGAAYLLYQAWTNNWGGIQEKAAAVWAFVQPLLSQLWTWLSTNIPIALQTLSAFWTGTLWPAIQAVWGWMSSTLFPFLGALANFIGAVLGIALTALAGIWQNVLWPAIKKYYDFFAANVFPIFQRFDSFLVGNFLKSLGWLSDRIRDVTDWLNKMADKLRQLKLPDWLTPGSPTPFEIGLRGIGEAMDSLAGSSLPTFGAQLQLSPVGAGPAGMNLQPSASALSAVPGGGNSQSDNDPMMREIYRMLRDLPKTIAQANRDAFEKVKRSS